MDQSGQYFNTYVNCFHAKTVDAKMGAPTVCGVQQDIPAGRCPTTARTCTGRVATRAENRISRWWRGLNATRGAGRDVQDAAHPVCERVGQ